MSPRKLTESDKQEILTLYQTPHETTSTLAERFSVSSSTISRFLKSRLNEQEYEHLIQQKRLSRTPNGAATVLQQYAHPEEPPAPSTTPKPQKRRIAEPDAELPTPAIPEPFVAEDPEPVVEDQTLRPKKARRIITTGLKASVVPEDEHEPEAVIEDLLADNLNPLGDEDDEFDDDGDWDDEEDDDEEDDEELAPQASPTEVEVLPLSRATLPRTCYLVIDRMAELITRPLHEFGDLGSIPSDETGQRTLPIFDNHRVARRFSQQRSHRVIKVPDSKLFEKTRVYLQAKGITRILLDGQIYSL
ncbi:MAG: transposase [Spirulina sp. DLM2.Bin59]|nr:MAG: transposase [Spirulina sp. DLM2.Bin59]